jgi:uncharacterized protein
MRIVLDTNVFISGIFFSGPPAAILKAWRDSLLQIVISLPIIEEYQQVSMSLVEKYPRIDIQQIIDIIMIKSEFVDVNNVVESVCEDQDDDKFIECAIAGNCKIIISGDKHLLKVSGYKGITVLKPGEFTSRFLIG